MRDAPITTDLLIVGAGPVGLFAVFEAGLLGLSCHLVDNLDKIGGQCAELYPEKPIYDIPAVPFCTGQGLIDALVEQAAPFNPSYHLQDQVAEMIPQDKGRYRVTTREGLHFDAGALVIAAGAGAFVPRRPLLDGIQDYEARGQVIYAVRNREALRGKRLVIQGGGDSALDWTLDLLEIASHITLVHRRDGFKAAPASVARMKALAEAGKIDFKLGQITALEGQAGQLSGVLLKGLDGETEVLASDVLLPLLGLKMELGAIAHWGLELTRDPQNKEVIAVDTEKFQTSIPGVYAIGDINYYPGKLKLILSGFHEAALMAHAAYGYIYPDKKIRFQYSSASTDLQAKLGVSKAAPSAAPAA